MAVVNILPILLLLGLSYFLSATGSDYSMAQLSTTWMNNYNDFEGPNKLKYDGWDWEVIILLKEIPGSGMGFACGFFRTDDYDHFAIWVVRKRWYSGEDYWMMPEYEYSATIVIWVANREKGVHENGTLSLLPDGDLVLRDSDGTLVWSTNTSNRSVVGMKLTETGNLVLHDRDNVTVWQSSDYSEDTLLDGQKGKKLVARNSKDDWRKGENYHLNVTSQGLFAFYKSQLYFKYPVLGSTGENNETSYLQYTNGTLRLYVPFIEPFDVFSSPLIILFMRLDPDGHFTAYTKENRTVDIFAYLMTDCDYPMACGNFGLCLSGGCSCPVGYVKDSVSHKCREESPTRCDGPNSNELQHLPDVGYFNYKDNDAEAIRGTSLEHCKQVCLANCSCKVALFQQLTGDTNGNCYLPSPVLTLISDFPRGGIKISQSFAFIKIPNEYFVSPVGSSRSVDNTSRTMRIAVSSVGAFIILMAIAIWIVCSRKRRGIDKDGDDNFEQVEGMPTRFSYEELKVATMDFQTKLGEGGFGSVFEGQLSSGEKIAVKRLDGLGQGRKEFLAEVITIGNIHHVNLVRLIGFCAEKLNRLLVYEFMCNGSLDRWIFSKNLAEARLDLQLRMNIILDIAKGLAYLHDECRQRILHLDIKPQNILLDTNFRARVSDFGLSKLVDRDESKIVTTMRGTPGYLAPEWLTSVITEKADVYSFGIVVMEVVCGRKNLDRSQPEELMHLLCLFKTKAEADQLVDLVDKYIVDNMEALEAVKMMRLAAWCLQGDYTRRPSMSVVVKVIEGSMDIDVNLNYSFPDPTLMVRITNDFEMKTTATMLPSILSAPR